ncbi:MAG: asparagine synthase (glutamine-hydrolyzing) [Acutalibacteraceae bacterium]|nr:asparagine synthase (glutamine-hydrolyzing) [Clostridia bacterium]MEE1330666.1 asparagine synthase (glutamine-hydrolyzing) [Acutalibacteraceae bacterium]
MCGFTGFTNFIKDDGTVLGRMMDRIVHRGPDASGQFVDTDIALGFRRLSIIDLAEGGQPMFNEDKSLVLVFNGEIYNFKELRAELLEKGHIFANNSDSEVLLHGFEEWGENMVPRLRGMFAFVIFDRRDRSLFAARDMFGIKPFYYTFMGESFIFGSEIKSFLEHPDFKKELNEEALAHYLSFQYSPTEETFFKGVYKLPPAHYFTFKNGEMKKTRYFKPDFNSKDGVLEYFADLTDKAVRESVAAHKIADVEVGSFLSSGIDSSYIAEAANVDKTFTVGFESPDGDRYNEIHFAKKFADTIGVENISKIITPEEYWGTFPKIQYHMDEPLADPAAIALYFVSELASKYVKVVMSGEGADELFGGYRIYQEPITLTAYDKLPFCIRRVISRVCEHLPQKHGINYLVRRGKTIEERFIGNASIFSTKERNALLKSETAKKAVSPQVLCGKFYNEVKDKDDITKMQYLDINMWLMGDILLKADKTSMANSLELRVPFLDKKVMELAETIPLNCRVNTKTTKLALRKAAEKTLPKLTAEKDKLGFPVPIRVWLKEDKYYNTVKEEFTGDIADKFFNTEKLVALLDNHRAGKADNSRRIWTVYTFIIWYKQYFTEA